MICLPPMLQTYALSCHSVFPRCNRSRCKTMKHPHEIYLDWRMTNRLDSGQEKSSKKGPNNTSNREYSTARRERENPPSNVDRKHRPQNAGCLIPGTTR